MQVWHSVRLDECDAHFGYKNNNFAKRNSASDEIPGGFIV